MNLLLVILHVSMLVSSRLIAACPRICRCTPVTTKSWTNNGTSPTIRMQHDCVLNTNYSLSTLLARLDANLTNLSLKASLLRSFNAICRFRYLQHLDLSWNDFVQILNYESYVVCSRLVTLNLAHNHVKRLRRNEFASFPVLEDLDLSYNDIFEIREDSLHLPMLKKLNLRHNRLKTIPGRIFRFASSLEAVDLSMNEFRTIDLSSFCYLRAVEYLNISGNHLQSVHAKAFDGDVQLVTLDLSNNFLTALPDSYMLRSLKNLILDNNRISVLGPVGEFSGLENLSISNTPGLRMVLSKSFWKVPNLKTLIMRKNPNLGYFSEDSFPEDTALQSIDLRDSNLRVIGDSILRQPNLTTVLLKNNPLDLQCWNQNRAKQDELFLDVSMHRQLRSAKCNFGMFPHAKTTQVLGKLGAPIRMYCCALTNDNAVTLNWTFSEHLSSERYVQTPEYLEIKYTQENDSGSYVCSALRDGRMMDKRIIDLFLEIPEISISFHKITHYYITVAWNYTTAETDKFGFYLRIHRTEADDTWVQSPSLTKLTSTYSFVNLAPSTNYTVCISYQPQGKIFYEQCLDAETAPVVYSHVGLTLNYTLIALLSGILLICCGFGWIKCIYHRFHVWQREKLQSRMQESISAQGFFSSFDSLSSANVAVTYENAHRLEAVESPEEAVRLVKHNAQLHSTPNCPQNGVDDSRRSSAYTM